MAIGQLKVCSLQRDRNEKNWTRNFQFSSVYFWCFLHAFTFTVVPVSK